MSGLLRRKLHISPHLRPMHVHHALRRPDPVVLFFPRRLEVFAVNDIGRPLDAREIDTPLVAIFGRSGTIGKIPHPLPSECPLYGPPPAVPPPPVNLPSPITG